MQIPKLKVKPRRVAQFSPCAVELTAMLSCWASSGDLMSTNKCQEAAKNLHICMSKPMPKGKAPKSTINYHLGRMGRG